MDNKVENFVNGLGAIVDTWMLVYTMFLKKGLTPTEAIVHTREFMAGYFGHESFNSGGSK